MHGRGNDNYVKLMYTKSVTPLCIRNFEDDELRNRGHIEVHKAKKE